MNKNTKCLDCGKTFEEGEGIYIVKHDNGSVTYLCENCFKEKYENDAEFKSWWDNDTRSLSMDNDELDEEFGCGSLEELNESSYYTTFEEDEEDEEETYTVKIIGSGTRSEIIQSLKSMLDGLEIESDEDFAGDYEDKILCMEIK